MKLKVLVMSVGPIERNGTVRYLRKIGGKTEDIIVCLPKQFEEHAKTYEGKASVYIYDEKKYIGNDFEFFGFKRRNCGGVGRQGIAEATEKFDGDDVMLLQLDDDTSTMNIRKKVSATKYKATMIKKWEDLARLIECEDRFFDKTGIYCMAATGATPPKDDGEFICNRKVFNNFIMRKGNRINFAGFKALCSDDYRFNLINSLYNLVPMISHNLANITFAQNQGDRKDGNAVLYNSDCSWKKSFALKMIMPCAVKQYISSEENRVLFRENIEAHKIFPPICLADKNGKIIGRLR